MTETRVIETHALRKQFGPTLAVADLSLQVGAGEIFGFLGPNGAGKTTSIKMLLALVAPTAGNGQVLALRSAIATPVRGSGFCPSTSAFTTRSARSNCCDFTAGSMACAASRSMPASIGC